MLWTQKKSWHKYWVLGRLVSILNTEPPSYHYCFMVTPIFFLIFSHYMIEDPRRHGKNFRIGFALSLENKGRCDCMCVIWGDLTFFSLSFIYYMQRIDEYSLIYLVTRSMLLEMHCLSIFLKCWNNSVSILSKIGLLPLNWSDNNTMAAWGFSQVVLIPLMPLTNQRLPVRILYVTTKLEKAWNIKITPQQEREVRKSTNYGYSWITLVCHDSFHWLSSLGS